MVKIALTVEGETDEVIAAIRQLAVGDGLPVAIDGNFAGATSVSHPTKGGTPDPPAPHEDWTPDHVRMFWGFLASDAKDIYRKVARANGYTLPRQSLLTDMRLSIRQLSGRLSSQGHAVRRIRKSRHVTLPHPMTFDSQSQEYKMLPDVADPLVKLGL